MPMTEVALMGLACVLANSPTSSQQADALQISEPEKAYVQQVVDSGLCQSDDVQALLSKTQMKSKDFIFSELASGGSGQPCAATVSE